MPLVLGIDTGGTYTDGVLLDTDQKKVIAKSKALTTPANLARGIRECIAGMDALDPGNISLVSLSTTLATNAVVEGRSCRVGLILIGGKPEGPIPAQHIYVVGGGHDIKGLPQRELDVGALEGAIANLTGQVDAVAVSGFLSIRNPEHELTARDLIRKHLGITTVCGHELTSSLGFYERTVTACLNAGLVPVIEELLVAVREVLQERQITGPLMIVKGNGSLMSEAIARERPIETILSGPAASVRGAVFLTGRNKAVALDMGGTTTDIAFLEEGFPQLTQEGATVGGWKTRVEAAQISTFGLGGDSYLRLTPDLKPAVGPKRVIPVSWAADRYPHLTRELAAAQDGIDLHDFQPVDSWILVKTAAIENYPWTEGEKRIIQALSQGPHNIYALAEEAELEPDLLPLSRLEQAQVVGRISLTPTDLLHIRGTFRPWNAQAARLAAQILAQRMNMQLENFLDAVFREITNSLAKAILQSLLDYEGVNLDLAKDKGAGYFLERALAPTGKYTIKPELFLDYPIVAIGAPVSAYLPQVGQLLHTEVLIPPHAEVANAVGAASGQVVELVEVTLKPHSLGGIIVHAPWGRDIYMSLPEAREAALAKAQPLAQAKALAAGAINPQILVDAKDIYSATRNIGMKIYLETRITVTAKGYPYGEQRLQ